MVHVWVIVVLARLATPTVLPETAITLWVPADPQPSCWNANPAPASPPVSLGRPRPRWRGGACCSSSWRRRPRGPERESNRRAHEPAHGRARPSVRLRHVPQRSCTAHSQPPARCPGSPDSTRSSPRRWQASKAQWRLRFVAHRCAPALRNAAQSSSRAPGARWASPVRARCKNPDEVASSPSDGGTSATCTYSGKAWKRGQTGVA